MTTVVLLEEYAIWLLVAVQCEHGASEFTLLTESCLHDTNTGQDQTEHMPCKRLFPPPLQQGLQCGHHLEIQCQKTRGVPATVACE